MLLFSVFNQIVGTLEVKPMYLGCGLEEAVMKGKVTERGLLGPTVTYLNVAFL